MRRRVLIVAIAAVTASGCLIGAAPAAAIATLAHLSPVDVSVEGGADSWHPEPSFRISWSRPDSGALVTPATTAVDYLVRDAAGNVVVPRTRIPWYGDVIEGLGVPPVPGAYTAEFWLEAEPGLEGAHATASLRFDDTRPGPARAGAAASWFGAGAEPSLRIEGADGPVPISGIRGYAVSVDHEGISSPCADPAWCLGAEIDLPAAEPPGALPLGALPEGVNVVRVAAVSGSGVRSAAATRVEVRVDLTAPTIALSGVPAGWANGPVQLTATARDPLSGMAPSGPSGPFTSISIDGGAAAIAQGGTVTTTVRGDGAHTVAYYARDAAGNSGGGSTRAPAAAAVRIDESAPQISFARSQDPAEPERIEARVSDRLSGPSPGHGTIAVRPTGAATPFQQLPTAVSGDRLSAVWNSDAFPPGDYEFRATGYDEAGNHASTDRRGDGSRMVLSNPLKQTTSLQFGFGGRRLVWQRCARVGEGRRCRREVIEDFGRRPRARSTGYGHETGVAGRLTAASGAPLPGMPVDVVETFDTGAAVEVQTTTVQTGSDGRFSARLAPGPSRRIEAVFGGNRVLSRAGGRQLQLGVLASVRLRASSARATIDGRPLVFSGRVDSFGAKIPSTGRPVQLQFRVAGMPWSEFRTVQTDAHGRFHYAYAFADDDSRGVRFQFRAVAPAEEGWPYEAAASRPVFVTGR